MARLGSKNEDDQFHIKTDWTNMVVMNSAVITGTGWSIQYVRCWPFDSSEFVSVGFKLTRKGGAGREFLTLAAKTSSGYFLKIFKSHCHWQRNLILFPTHTLKHMRTPTHTLMSMWCPEFDPAHCFVEAQTHNHHSRCVLDKPVFSLDDSTEAHWRQSKNLVKVKWL